MRHISYELYIVSYPGERQVGGGGTCSKLVKMRDAGSLKKPRKDNVSELCGPSFLYVKS